MFYFTGKILDDIAKETNQYGNEEWVRPVTKDNGNNDANNDGNDNGNDNGNDSTNDNGNRIGIGIVNGNIILK